MTGVEFSLCRNLMSSVWWLSGGFLTYLFFCSVLRRHLVINVQLCMVLFFSYFPLSAIILFGSLSAIFFQLDLTFCYLFVILFHRLLLPSRGPTNQYVFVISNPLNKPSVIPWYSCYSAVATAQNRHQSMTVGKELCPLYWATVFYMRSCPYNNTFPQCLLV